MVGFISAADFVLCKIAFACALACDRVAQAATLALLKTDKSDKCDSEHEKHAADNVFENCHFKYILSMFLPHILHAALN